jgi:hypothetical protein
VNKQLEDTLRNAAAEQRLKSPEELLAINDRTAFYHAVVEYVLYKHKLHGWESFTLFERTIWHAYDCEYREMQGTLLEEALEGEERCAILVAVLEEIGARAAAQALRRARLLYTAVPPERAARARCLADWYELVGEKNVDAIRAAMVEDEVSTKFFVYLNEHRERLQPE